MLRQIVFRELDFGFRVDQRGALLRRGDHPHAIVGDNARGERALGVVHPDHVLAIVRAGERRRQLARRIAVDDRLDDGAAFGHDFVANGHGWRDGHAWVHGADRSHGLGEIAAREHELVGKAQLFHQPHDALGATAFEVIDRDFRHRHRGGGSWRGDRCSRRACAKEGERGAGRKKALHEDSPCDSCSV